jgi:transcriptional regulator with XRE-family HTH domain
MIKVILASNRPEATLTAHHRSAATCPDPLRKTVMATIKDLLVAKLKELGISATAAAEKFGLSAPGVRAVAAGKSLPNARSLAKYADLLGVPADELKAAAAAARGGDAKPAKGKKPAKAKGGKPARKSMKKGARKAAAKAKPAAKGKGRGKAKGGALAALKAIESELSAAAALAGDDLAMKVHALSKKGRAVIAGLIGSLS